MAKKKNEITKTNDVKLDKISVFFRRPVLKNILKILTMEHAGFRTFKSVKNINKLFNNIDLEKYKGKPELESYIWCIKYVSKQWLDGIVTPDIIAEMAKNNPEYDNIKGEILSQSINDNTIISAPEAKAIFDLISEALQYGYVASLKEEYINLLDDIDMNNPGAFKEVVDRLFKISQSLVDIKHSTNLIGNKITFNTNDLESVKVALNQTIDSLSGTSNMLKVGIKRWNTLLSPAYMNGKIYVYAGAPGSGKSVVLQKSAFDIRKYNPNFVTKTPGMTPCVLYISMENTFIECIERLWNMTFDDPITNYNVDEAVDMLCKELGIERILRDDVSTTITNDDGSKENLLSKLVSGDNKDELNIQVVMKYFSYREISTDDLFTIIHDLRDENMEVCALVFDYIKRIEPSVPTPDSVKLELNHIINELKALAVICDIPVITAHQLNRTAASLMDSAIRSGKGDAVKMAGREHIGDAYEVLEVADFLALVNIEYKPGTDDKYLTMNVVKRRRIDQSQAEFAKYTYLAHPFAKNNGLRLLDDLYLDKVLSLQSLSTDINGITNKEKENAVPRLKTLEEREFIDLDDL